MSAIKIHLIAIVLLLISLIIGSIGYAEAMSANDKVNRWGPIAKREAQFIYGINAPVAMILGEIKQESGGDDKVTAFDGGMGISQAMKGTVDQMVAVYPELKGTYGPVNPYDATWAIRFQVRLLSWASKKVKADNACEMWGATLDGYNAGVGYVLSAQKVSPQPGKWFDVTEYIPI